MPHGLTHGSAWDTAAPSHACCAPRPNRSAARGRQPPRRRPLRPPPRQRQSACEPLPLSAGPQPASGAPGATADRGPRRQELEGLVLPSPAGRSWATPPPRVPALRHQPAPASDCRGPRGPLIPELTVGVSTASHVAVTVPFSTFGEPALILSRNGESASLERTKRGFSSPRDWAGLDYFRQASGCSRTGSICP